VKHSALTRRVAALEKRRPDAGAIALWCEDDPAAIAAAIAALKGRGEILYADVARCVHWAKIRTVDGAHERSLARLRQPVFTAGSAPSQEESGLLHPPPAESA
jgi:hypothetical protein